MMNFGSRSRNSGRMENKRMNMDFDTCAAYDLDRKLPQHNPLQLF